MQYRVKHITEYSYEDYVSYCHNLATLKPRNLLGQELLEYELIVDPIPAEISHRIDFFGNNLTRFSIQDLHKKLTVTTTSKIYREGQKIRESYNSEICQNKTMGKALEDINLLDYKSLDAKQFILESPLIRKTSPLFKQYAQQSFQPNRSVYDATKELMERIYTDFDFVPGITNIATPINEVIQDKKGVCQDFAHIAIACVRKMGLPARYMSGYIETLPPEGKEKLVGADASHAWFAVYIPGFGWVDFDPTNNQIPNDQHLVIAWGRDYHDVPPLKGVIYSNGANSLKVSVDIRRIED